VSENADRIKHYIVALPTSGIPKKVLDVIARIRKEHGVVYTSMYQSNDKFTRCTKKQNYTDTSFWIEFSEKPLAQRASPDWPIKPKYGR